MPNFAPYVRRAQLGAALTETPPCVLQVVDVSAQMPTALRRRVRQRDIGLHERRRIIVFCS